jgi:hypothetical protein
MGEKEKEEEDAWERFSRARVHAMTLLWLLEIL